MRRVVRKIDPPFTATDDLHWPVDVALVVLGAFVIGAALDFQRFDHPVWHGNAWSTLIGVPLLIGGGMLATRAVSRAWLRRSMQFGMLVSLFVHFALLLAAVGLVVPVNTASLDKKARDLVRERERRAVPDRVPIPMARHHSEPSDLERPVETPVPEPSEPIERERTETAQSPVEPQPQPVIERESTARPDIVKRERESESAPRRSEMASQLSRSRTERVMRPETTVPESRSAPRPSETAAPPISPSIDVAKRRPSESRSAASQEREQAAPPALAMRESVPTEPLPRPVRSDQPIPAESPIILRRESATAPFEPSLAAENEPRPAAQRSETPVLAPRDADVAQRTPEPSSHGRRDSEEMGASQSAVDPEVRRNASDDQPLVAQSPEPTPNQLARRTERVDRLEIAAPQTTSGSRRDSDARPEIAAADARMDRSASSAPTAERMESESATAPARAIAMERPSTASAPDAPSNAAPSPPSPLVRSSLPRSETAPPIDVAAAAERTEPSASPVEDAGGARPTDAPIARQAATSAAPTPRQPLDEPRSTSRDQVANTVSRRTIVSEEATTMPLERPTPRPARSVTNETLQTTVKMDHPAARVVVEPSPGSAQPSSIAVSKGTTGTAGSGYSTNVDRRAPSGESPSLVASGSSRDRATQRTAEGPALSPAESATVPRSRADHDSPLAAAPVPQTTSAPGAPPETSGRPHSASAATIEMRARSESGAVTADRGDAPVDIGPQRIVAQFQSGPASGGGQPEPTLSAAPNPARTSRGGATQQALDVDTTAMQVRAPDGDGGARPLAIDAQPTAVAAKRTDRGGETASSGGPASSLVEGRASESNAADAHGALALRRAPADSNDALGALQPNTDTAAAPSGTGASEPAPRRAASAPPTATAGRPTPIGTGRRDSESAVADPQGAERGSPPPSASATDVARRDPAELPSEGRAAHANAIDEVGPSSPPTSTASNERRAEPADGPAGPPLVGGGPRETTRIARAPRLGDDAFGNPTAESPVLNAMRAEGASAAPVASGVEMRKREGGISAGLDSAAETTADQPSLDVTRAAIRPRAGRSTEDEGPSTASATSAIARGRTRSGPMLANPSIDDGGPSARMARRAPPESRTPSDADGASASETPVAIGPTRRESPSSRPVDIDAEPGPGGLAATPTPDAGIEDRRASRETENVQFRMVRIPRRDLGGRPDVNTAPVIAAEAFRRRSDRNRGPSGGDRLGPETEQAIEAGLAFLARSQREDGRWTFEGFDDEQPGMRSDAAATALALLAFQGAGYTHREHRYASNVRSGLDFLIANQERDGSVFVNADEESNRFARLYTQGIAALALCEAYGMTRDPALAGPAQRAIDQIVASQNGQLGGWRYAPQVSSDTSVTGWMMMALKSGELAGLRVPVEAYEGVARWLDRAQASPAESHLYRYNPDAPDTAEQSHGRRASPSMTAVGLLLRLYLGWNRDHEAVRRGADYFRANLPAQGEPTDTILSRRRDTYYWYYATQVMFHVGGDAWKEWNARLHPMLARTQIADGRHAGSWDPFLPVADRWAGQAGRLYVTTLNLLSLEVHYRHLPLYKEEGRASP